MIPSPRPRILCVDDEPSVLENIERNLHRRFEIRTAGNGALGLEVIEREGPFAVVVSDMRMPGMNGAEFLSRARQLAPDTVRVLLTGQTDLELAIAAVNEGQIFRFLAKPCPTERLLQTLDASVGLYRLVTAERELLEKTLMGSLQMLNDVLALSNPEAFGRAARIRQYVSQLAAKYDVPSRWQTETAAMLSQLGYITLDPEIVAKLNRGHLLSVKEQRMVDRVSEVNERFLAHIPRLEGVRAMLAEASRSSPRDGAVRKPGNQVAFCGQLLRIALDFDRLDVQGLPLRKALDTMRDRVGCYDPEVLKVFGELREEEGGHAGVLEVPVASLRVGMVLAEDAHMRSGVLLAARGYVVTVAFVERARNFQPGTVVEPVRCIVQKPRGEAS